MEAVCGLTCHLVIFSVLLFPCRFFHGFLKSLFVFFLLQYASHSCLGLLRVRFAQVELFIIRDRVSALGCAFFSCFFDPLTHLLIQYSVGG